MSRVEDQDVQSLPGIGATTSARLRERGLATVGDLLGHLPRDYQDRRQATPIDALEVGQTAVVEGFVVSARGFGRLGKEGFNVRLGSTREGEGRELKLVWFRRFRGLEERFAIGRRVRVAGTVADYRGQLNIAHPEWIGRDDKGEIVPRYTDVSGVRTSVLRQAVQTSAKRTAVTLEELLPPATLQQHNLMTLGRAMEQVHCPSSDVSNEELERLRQGTSAAHRRLALEELAFWELLRRTRVRREVGARARVLSSDDAWQRALDALPFELTGAQQRAAREICDGLGQEEPMRRLLQGDVGSGKTAVAMVAVAVAVGAGTQAAFVAPTELLAEQHLQTLSPIASRLGIRIGFLSGSMSSAQQRAIVDQIATGNVDFVVGTHALFGSGMSFKSLGLVLVDEQHRFGVSQRLRLLRGPDRTPHLVVMTATPIPRTIALVLYAGMASSVIDELPPGRQPVTTRTFPDAARARALHHLERGLEAGGQAFVICPAVDTSEDMRSATQVHEELHARFGERVGLVHGRMEVDQRQGVMQAFVRHELDVLVGTTVLEVGVDVPNANVILVEQAERFGLAQLHQLRGRVGRGGQAAACLLVHGTELTEDAQARLQAMCETQSGFEIAERDLALRGPGHLFGRRQAGADALRYARLTRDADLLTLASTIVGQMLDADPNLEDPCHETARRAVDRWMHAEAVREDAG